jgi:hypothetical protein
MLIGAVSGNAEAQSTASEWMANDGWKTVIYPIHAWMPVFGADVNLPEGPGSGGGGSGGGGGAIPPVHVSSNFNGAAFAGFRVERWRLALQGEFMWAGMSGSLDAPRAEAEVTTTYGVLTGGFEVAPALYVDGGVRLVGLSLDATVLSFPTVTWKPRIWEPVIGATFRPTFGRKLRFIVQANVGGLGDSSHRTAVGSAVVEWKPFSHLSLGGGWSALYLRVDDTVLSKTIHLQQTLNGPVIAIGIPF